MERLRILVADDNVDCAAALAALFDRRGYAVREAYDGQKAFDTALEFHPHAMILDLRMPRMSGYDVAIGVRGRPWARDVLMIALSGWGEITDRRRSREVGFDYHVTKPTDFYRLVGLVERSDMTLHPTNKLLRAPVYSTPPTRHPVDCAFRGVPAE